MKTYQIREMSVEDLKNTLADSYEALENLRFQHSTGQLENYKSLTNTKRDIAKIKTLLREKELKINENFVQKNS
ncbi:MAG TPA: 50S ribosomal protein L29 [Ignavibacteria bacterium]|nr:50S ribosomal protein L29 [Ignavibacteria bacterium]HMR40388.1 50S ribosomal protein L29 [Ignavibacteria bacterium]